MTDVPAALDREVRRRARERCEYCRLPQEGQEARFHLDHIVPVSAGGDTSSANLALACVSCSLRKGHRQTGTDPETDEVVPLYHPRKDLFSEHFRWNGRVLIGLTATGRSTIRTLGMNRPQILDIREELMLKGRHPPPDDWPARYKTDR